MASKKLNRRFVIGLTLFTFLSMIALSVLMLLHLQKSDPGRLAAIAKQHMDAGEWRQAFSTSCQVLGQAWPGVAETEFFLLVAAPVAWDPSLLRTGISAKE